MIQRSETVSMVSERVLALVLLARQGSIYLCMVTAHVCGVKRPMGREYPWRESACRSLDSGAYSFSATNDTEEPDRG